MKKTITLIIILLQIYSCKVTEHPEFVKVENIKVIASNAKQVQLSANAFFKNPNHIGGVLKSEGINVLIDNIEVGNITTKAFNVPPQDQFIVPLTITIPTKKILDKNNISGLLNSLINNKLKAQYKGSITYQLGSFSYKYPIDQEQLIKIKL